MIYRTLQYEFFSTIHFKNIVWIPISHFALRSMMSALKKLDNFLRTKESIFRESQVDNKQWGNEDLDPTP